MSIAVNVRLRTGRIAIPDLVITYIEHAVAAAGSTLTLTEPVGATLDPATLLSREV